MKKTIALLSAAVMLLSSLFVFSSCGSSTAGGISMSDKYGTYAFDSLLFSASSLGKTKDQYSDYIKNYTYEIYPDKFVVVGEFGIKLFSVGDSDRPDYQEHDIAEGDSGYNETLTLPVNDNSGTYDLLGKCVKYCDICYSGRELAVGDIGYRLFYNDKDTYLARFTVSASGSYVFTYIAKIIRTSATEDNT